MSGEDKSKIYKSFSDLQAALTEEMAIGSQNIYVTIERSRYNQLLKDITEMKKVLIRPSNNLADS